MSCSSLKVPNGKKNVCFFFPHLYCVPFELMFEVMEVWIYWLPRHPLILLYYTMSVFTLTMFSIVCRFMYNNVIHNNIFSGLHQTTSHHISFCSSGSSACENIPCQLCQLTKANQVGFICACPNFKVLLLDGKCECRFTIITFSHVKKSIIICICIVQAN